ncbi:MAG: hypothetical protein EOP49_29425, partial [Sphingobacteriales bacterium]
MNLSTQITTSCFPAIAKLAAGSCVQPAPFIFSFTPTSATQGANVTITGTGFTGTTGVSFGGVPGTNVQVLSSTSVRARPAGGASGVVTVTTPFGTASRAGFTYAGQGTAQSINMATIPNKVFGDPDFALLATATSGLTVTFSSSDPTVAQVTGSTVRILGAGTVTITAQQNGNSTFAPAATVSRTFTISKATQSITFAALPTKELGDAAFDAGAVSTSGLPIIYSSSNENVALVVAGKVTLTAPGTATITASQPGNSNYDAATSVSQTINVTLTLATNNFSVSATGETCRNSDN